MEVYIKIADPILRCYLTSVFEERADGYVVSMGTLTGVTICALSKEAAHPAPRDPADKTIMKFYLPRSRYTDSKRNRFLQVTAEHEALINATLKKEFDSVFRDYCVELRQMGMKLKDIIPMFIEAYNLYIFDGDIETLKKRYYRRELDTFKKLREMLRQKAYYHSKTIKKQQGKPVKH